MGFNTLGALLGERALDGLDHIAVDLRAGQTKGDVQFVVIVCGPNRFQNLIEA
jgi:hypothetical protein